MSLSPKILRESQSHLKSINDIIFLDDKNFLITAGADGSSKIYETSTLKMLKKLSFRVNMGEKNNYSMRGLRYDKYKGYLYTIQALMRGNTYLTKWDVKNNFEPVSTINASDSICTSIDYSERYNLIGLADVEGKIIYIDASNEMSVIKVINLSEITIKSIAFKNQNLVTGAADNALQINFIVKPNLISVGLYFKFIFLIIFGYYMYLKSKN
jgi:WD40 repeat protein